MKSPFKFLDPYTSEDRKVFFGRDTEVARLYNLIYKSQLLLVYGQSGTGKTSLIQCGLGSRFDDTDWYPISIRRNDDINHSLAEALAAPLGGKLYKNKIDETVSYLYKNYLRPIYLIFDQFEELFILGSKEEQDAFIGIIQRILVSELPCKILLVMREEYIAHLYRFEQIIPTLFDCRLRVEKMNYTHVAQVIIGSCKAFNIKLESKEKNVRQIIDQISGGRSGIQLPYLQVYLDWLWQSELKRTYRNEKVVLQHTDGRPYFPALKFTSKQIGKAGNIEEVLEKFLKRQVHDIQNKIHESYPEISFNAVWQVLDVFVTEDGTKRPAVYNRGENGEIFMEKNLTTQLQKLPAPALQQILDALEKARILRINENQIEVAHDTLADLIDSERTGEQRQINQVKQRITAAYTEQRLTGEYLTQRQLDSIQDTLPKLGLSPHLLAFVEESYEDVKKKQQEESEHRHAKLKLVTDKLRAEKEKVEVEQKSRIKMHSRLRIMIGLVVISIIAAAWGWAMRVNAVTAESKSEEILEGLYQERTRLAMKKNNHQKAWLYNLAALNQVVTPVSLSRLLLPNHRPGEPHLYADNGSHESTGSGDHHFQKEGHEVPLQLIENNTLFVMDVSKKENLMAVGGSGNHIELIDIKKNKVTKTLNIGVNRRDATPAYFSENFIENSAHTIQNMAFNADGRFLAFSTTAKIGYSNNKTPGPDSLHHTLFIWDHLSEEPNSVYTKSLNANVIHFAFSPDGKLLATGMSDLTIKLWKIEKNKLVEQSNIALKNTSLMEITSLSFNSNSNLLAMGITTMDDPTHEQRNTVEIWNFKKESFLQNIPLAGKASCLRFMQKNNYLVIGDSRGNLAIWDPKRKKSRKPFVLPTVKGKISRLEFIYDENMLVSLSSEGIQFWDWENQQNDNPKRAEIAATDLDPDMGIIEDFVVLENHERIYAGTPDGKLILLELEMHLFKGKVDGLNNISLRPLLLNPYSKESKNLLSKLQDTSINYLGYEMIDTELHAKAGESSPVEKADTLFYEGRGNSKQQDSYAFVLENLIPFQNQVSAYKHYPNITPDSTIVFTSDGLQGAASAYFLKSEVLLPFEVEFEYAIYNSEGKYNYNWKVKPADGITFMFLKDIDTYTKKGLPSGGAIGYHPDGSGFGIQFRTFDKNDILLKNGNNKTLDSIPDTHLRGPIYSHGQWRKVKVNVKEDSILVDYMGENVISWSGSVTGAHTGLGFAATTGAADSRQQIRNVKVMPLREGNPRKTH